MQDKQSWIALPTLPANTCTSSTSALALHTAATFLKRRFDQAYITGTLDSASTPDTADGEPTTTSTPGHQGGEGGIAENSGKRSRGEML